MKRRNSRTSLALLLVPLALGAALRFWFAWSWRAAPQFPADPEEGYYGSAIELLGRGLYTDGLGNETPRAWRGPLYPTFLALAQSVTAGPLPGPARLAQAAASTLCVALVFALAQAVVSPLAGFAAALALALDPGQIAQVSSLNVHGFYSLWLLLLACLAVRWVESEGAVSAAAALGAALGAGLLCRSSHFLAAPLLLGGAAAWWGAGQKARLGWAAFAAAAALALAPMALRNAALFSRFLPLPDRDAGSVVLYCATLDQGPCSTLEHALAYAEAERPGFRASVSGGEEALHPALFALAARRIEDRPWHYARRCLSRLVSIWRGLWPYLALALFAVLRAPRDRGLWAVVLIAASFSGYALAGGAEEHMRAVVPLLTALAGCALALALAPRVRKEAPPWLLAPRRIPPVILGIAAGLAAAVYAAMLGFLALEARRYWLPRLRGLAPVERSGARELAALRVAAENGGPEDRRRYGRASALAGAADAGGRLLEDAERAARLGERARALDLAARAEARGLYSDERERRLLAVYCALRDYERGAALLERLSRRRSGDEELLVEQAELAADFGRRAPALAFAARAEARGLDADGTRRLLRLYRGAKAYSEATALLVRVSRGDAEPWLETAELAAEAGERKPALDWLARAEKLGFPGGDPDGLKTRRVALAYQSLKEYPRALALFARLTRSFPASARSFSDKGVCEDLMGDERAAVADLRTALRLDPGFPPAALTLGAVLERQGLAPQASEVYARALANAAATDPLRKALTEARTAVRSSSASGR